MSGALDGRQGDSGPSSSIWAPAAEEALRSAPTALRLPQIVGIAGYAQSGKDTAASLLASYGYQRASWADRLRQAVEALDPIVGGHRGRRYTEVVAEFGYEGAKTHPLYGPEVRRTLIRMGTEVGRDLFGADFWVRQLLDSLPTDERFVIPDTRFPNEAQAVKDAGGMVIRIERPGVGAVADHPSETSLVDWDYDAVIVNDATVEVLGWRLAKMVSGWSS